MQNFGLYFMAFLYIVAGVYHFVKPKFYLYMMPSYIPAHKLMVSLSGVAEIIFGVMLLFPQTRSVGAWGIILMLISFFTVHIYMLTDEAKFYKIPKIFRWIRIPLQFLLIWWAYSYR
ncbi:MAG: DoxX family protein [Arcicella sp.]|nr:DoxX family protein [Arcicella sp.]